MSASNKQRRLTSLLLVEERLLEAHFFNQRLRNTNPSAVGYILNAYLSAARSVTFLLQKELSHVDGFLEWWEGQRSLLAKDESARFFLLLRNFSQKAGRVSVVGVKAGQGRFVTWRYRFVGRDFPVPEELLGVDVADACTNHLAKLSRVVLACMDAFPVHSCPSVALSSGGVETLGLDVCEAFEVLGLPFVEGDDELAWRVLRQQVDPVNVACIRKLAFPSQRRVRGSLSASDELANELLAAFERRQSASTGHPSLAELVEDLLISKV